MLSESEGKTVLVLKSHDEKYVKVFQDNGYRAVFSDVLMFKNENVELLKNVLTNLHEYEGVIITSPRAAFAIVNAIESIEHIDSQLCLQYLKNIPIFSVGKATSKPLNALGIDCLGDESGSAEVLADFIEKYHSTKGKMVFLCGNKRMNTLPQSFQKRQQTLDELVVYSSSEIGEIEWLKTNTPQWIVFFSPSGVKAAHRMHQVPWSRIQKAAIGKSSAAALQQVAEATHDTTWIASAVAAKPTPDALVDAMKD